MIFKMCVFRGQGEMDWKAEREVSEYGMVFMNSGTQTSYVGGDLYNAYI